MRTLKTSEAAALLNVSANTLRAWERRFDYPQPQRTAGKHRVYVHGEVAALRDALRDGLSISSAVSRARESLRSDTHILVGALASFELERADGAMEAALAMRSLERTVEEVLLPSIAELARRSGTDSAAWAIGSRWATEWLRRAQRMTPPPVRPGAILIGDATADDLDPDAPVVRALELCTGRTGIRVASIPIGNHAGVAELLAALRPGAVIIAGRHASDEEIARFAYAVRSAGGALPLALFQRGDDRVSRTSSVHHLAASPSEATAEALALLDGHGGTVSSIRRSLS
ncbi:MAG: MerR family transcriptional regulator, light-induced transcriptional regulator [Solirubrobacteraceae bacterium]|jgi:DNA-binding transcriptional MerR regulator|nr:MerR family transcriptional regulator, light-induced transcriptional regulator [Solirubrobacteraceae bacterium]